MGGGGAAAAFVLWPKTLPIVFGETTRYILDLSAPLTLVHILWRRFASDYEQLVFSPNLARATRIYGGF